MNIKKVAIVTACIFLAVILMSTLLGSCAGPSSAMNGQNGYGGGQSYNDNSGHGWLWGTLAGAAAGYGLAKYFNRNNTNQSPQQKSVTPKTSDKKVTTPNHKQSAPAYKPSAPSKSYKPSAPTKKR